MQDDTRGYRSTSCMVKEGAMSKLMYAGAVNYVLRRGEKSQFHSQRIRIESMCFGPSTLVCVKHEERVK